MFEEEETSYIINLYNISNPKVMQTPWKFNPMFEVIVTIHSLTFAIGMLTNIAAILALVADGSRKHGHVFLGSAITADLILLAFGVPLRTVEYFVLDWDQHGIVCKTAIFIDLLTASSSVMNMTGVSLERFVLKW
jgi:hypothetical protein